MIFKPLVNYHIYYFCCQHPVSYTHLDVYKRQVHHTETFEDNKKRKFSQVKVQLITDIFLFSYRLFYRACAKPSNLPCNLSSKNLGFRFSRGAEIKVNVFASHKSKRSVLDLCLCKISSLFQSVESIPEVCSIPHRTVP